MDYYFLIITIIDVFTLCVMSVLTMNNETLNKRQRNLFILSFSLISFISVMEVITVLVNGAPTSLRWIHIVANYLGFGLTPAVAIFLAAALNTNKSTKYAFIAEIIYMAFLAMTYGQRTIFYVDRENQYMRGDFFAIYMVLYCASIIYLLATTMLANKSYQNRSRNSIFFIALFLFTVTIIQIVFPEIHVTWLCVTIISILFFTYCNGMWQQLDRLTGLLNQNSYLNRTASLSQNGTLLIFDVDDFKKVNDTFGHLKGDKCLEIIARCLKKAYFNDGLCYRIGGDEFCVLLSENANAELCYQKFEKELRKNRNTVTFLPYVSVGSATYVNGDNILKVKEEADRMLYQVKKMKKAGI